MNPNYFGIGVAGYEDDNSEDLSPNPPVPKLSGMSLLEVAQNRRSIFDLLEATS